MSEQSYILLRSFENDSLVYCDIYSIKFITISTTGIMEEIIIDIIITNIIVAKIKRKLYDNEYID